MKVNTMEDSKNVNDTTRDVDCQTEIGCNVKNNIIVSITDYQVFIAQ